MKTVHLAISFSVLYLIEEDSLDRWKGASKILFFKVKTKSLYVRTAASSCCCCDELCFCGYVESYKRIFTIKGTAGSPNKLHYE